MTKKLLSGAIFGLATILTAEDLPPVPPGFSGPDLTKQVQQLFSQAVAPKTTTEAPFLTVTKSDVDFSTFPTKHIQVEPWPTNTTWCSNIVDQTGSNYFVISGTVRCQAFIGPTVVWSWSQQSQPVVIQTSSNLLDWEDIRVWQIGTTNWLGYSGDNRQFVRVRVVQ